MQTGCKTTGLRDVNHPANRRVHVAGHAAALYKKTHGRRSCGYGVMKGHASVSACCMQVWFYVGVPVAAAVLPTVLHQQGHVCAVSAVEVMQVQVMTNRRAGQIRESPVCVRVQSVAYMIMQRHAAVQGCIGRMQGNSKITIFESRQQGFHLWHVICKCELQF